MHKTITIPKQKFEQLTRENRELQLALKAVLAGERALRAGKTRPLSEFLRAKFPEHAQDF